MKLNVVKVSCGKKGPKIFIYFQIILESGVLGVMGVYCISWLVIRLFHLTSFVWMFLEGMSQIEKVCRNFFD